jgi:hypothetical protein
MIDNPTRSSIMSTNMEKLSITVPKDVAEMLREYVPQGQVSSFISDALSFKLQIEKQRRGLEVGKGAWKDEDHPDLTTPEDTVNFIRSLRATSRDRLKRVGAIHDES